MGFYIALFLFLAFVPPSLSQEVIHASILVNGNQAKAETDDNFICATIDWWPHDKCDYDHCPWGYSSVNNLDLSHPFLAKAVQGSDPNLDKKILDPGHLSNVASTFGNLSESIEKVGPWSSAWVGEAGGAYNSGSRYVSSTFLNSFWYLDQLGMASTYNTKVYCRQTLIGGYYGLLNITTFTPNPDYFSALLWQRLMGKKVLQAYSDSSSPYLRTYAHCSKGREGVTVLLINLSNHSNFVLNVQNPVAANNEGTKEVKSIRRDNSFTYHLKKTFSWVGTKGSYVTFREEYHLTPKDGDTRSRTVLLNGIPIQLTSQGDIPNLDPVRKNVQSPIYVAPLSVVFVVYPNFDAPACVSHQKN